MCHGVASVVPAILPSDNLGNRRSMAPYYRKDNSVALLQSHKHSVYNLYQTIYYNFPPKKVHSRTKCFHLSGTLFGRPSAGVRHCRSSQKQEILEIDRIIKAIMIIIIYQLQSLYDFSYHKFSLKRAIANLISGKSGNCCVFLYFFFLVFMCMCVYLPFTGVQIWLELKLPRQEGVHHISTLTRLLYSHVPYRQGSSQ
jgi:hypothetical protein